MRYREVYPGVDLVYYGNAQRLEYDFVVAPGGDPDAIRLAFEGADGLALDGEGNLRVRTTVGTIVQQAPMIYQIIAGVKHKVGGRYRLVAPRGKETLPLVGFELAEYDTQQPLVIDPVLWFSTFLGGSGSDEAIDIAVDNTGATYITGFTTSLDFPITGGAFQPIAAGTREDAFVVKLSATDASNQIPILEYATYLGGNSGDIGFAIAVDSIGQAYITGDTGSSDFPTANAVQTN